MPSPDALLMRSSNHVATRLDDGGVALLQIGSGFYYTLHEVGAYVWELLATPHTSRQLGEAVARCYAIDTQHAQRDVDAFLTELVQADLLTTKAT